MFPTSFDMFQSGIELENCASGSARLMSKNKNNKKQGRKRNSPAIGATAQKSKNRRMDGRR
jgi:hypothetical protein